MTDKTIKSMMLYPKPQRIFDDLAALGFGRDAPLPVQQVNTLDQLHYHGTEALDVAIDRCAITATHRILEVGSGWGGCARYIAHRTGAFVTAVELQEDYDHVARDLTRRTGLEDNVGHVNADFLRFDVARHGFDHAVSWLALFHIPDRGAYLGKIHRGLKQGGYLFAEDLYLKQDPPADEKEDFSNHLFPNSLVRHGDYLASLKEAGFERIEVDDMTADWAAFTASRLEVFHANRAAYEAIHGPEGYATLETFYAKMSDYFARGLVGGLRFRAVAG